MTITVIERKKELTGYLREWYKTNNIFIAVTDDLKSAMIMNNGDFLFTVEKDCFYTFGVQGINDCILDVIFSIQKDLLTA